MIRRVLALTLVVMSGACGSDGPVDPSDAGVDATTDVDGDGALEVDGDAPAPEVDAQPAEDDADASGDDADATPLDDAEPDSDTDHLDTGGVDTTPDADPGDADVDPGDSTLDGVDGAVGDDATADVAPDVDERRSTLQVAHVGRGVSVVDVFLAGDPFSLFDGLGFATATGYVPAPLSARPLAFATPGTTDFVAQVTPEFGYHVDEVWTGGLVGAAGEYAALVFREDNSVPPDGIRWRVINGIPGTTIDMYFISDETGPQTFYERVPFGTRGLDQSHPPAHYTVAVDLDNTEPPDFGFDLGELDFGSQITMWAGRGDDDVVFLLVTRKDGGWALASPLPIP